MNPALQGYLAAVTETLADAGALVVSAGELEAVARLVETSSDLSYALSDVAVPVAARRHVLQDLLADRVRPEVLDVVLRAVDVVAAAELIPALHWLASQVTLAAEYAEQQSEHAVDEPVLGLMASRHRVAGYAAAVFAKVSTGELEEIEDELFRFARTVEGHRPLRLALGDRDLPVRVRQGVVADLLGDRVRPSTRRLAAYAIRGGRPRDIVGTLDTLVEEAARARGWRVAKVHAADEVGEDRRRGLADALSRLTGGPVELQISLDATLLGGVVVEVGDLLLDSSTRHRLVGLREHLHTSEAAYQVAQGRDEN